MMHELCNGCVLVERNDSSVSNARTDGGQFFEPKWRVEQLRRDDAGEWPTNDDTFERSVIAQATAEFLDNMAHSHAELDFVETGADKERVERNDFGPATPRKSERLVGIASAGDDPWNIRESLAAQPRPRPNAATTTRVYRAPRTPP